MSNRREDAAHALQLVAESELPAGHSASSNDDWQPKSGLEVGRDPVSVIVFLVASGCDTRQEQDAGPSSKGRKDYSCASESNKKSEQR